MRALGFDIQSLGRFEAIYGNADRETMERCFTRLELQTAGEGADAMSRLAARFSAKEATFKALGGVRDGIALTDIEIVTLPGGAPELALHGGAALLASKLHLSKWLVSLSHTDDVVGAVVVAF